MVENKTNAGQGLGIAGLVLGIIALMVCFIPCIGIFAIVPGLVGITLSAIAYNQAIKGNGLRGLIIAALVISILGSSVALLQGVIVSTVGKNGDKWINMFDDKVERETGKTIDENIEDIGDQVGSEMEDVLNKLENVDDSIHIDIKIGKKLSDEEFEKLMIDYENLIKETIKISEKSKSGESEAAIHYSKLALKLAAVHAKLLATSPNLSKEQHRKLEEINNKYKKELNDLKN